MKKLLSVIVSCFNEESALPLFYKEMNRVSKSMKEVDFEFIFVDDGSRDNTLDVIKTLKKKDKRV